MICSRMNPRGGCTGIEESMCIVGTAGNVTVPTKVGVRYDRLVSTECRP